MDQEWRRNILDTCCLLQGEVRVASSGQEIVSVASRVVNPKHDELHPAGSKELYQLRPMVSASCILVVYRVVKRRGMSCIERYEYTKCPTI